MKRVGFGLLVVTLAASPGWAAGLKLTIRDGKVSLDAQEVTVRQILTEWARVGKTRIINLERVTSGPMTLQLDGVPEEQALDIILRSVPGYMAAPRAAGVRDASIYDRILIMPTTTAVAPRPPAAGSPTAFQPFPPASPGVTQLRGTPVLFPGLLPEQPSDDGPDFNDPAIAAAAAAGLVAVPAPFAGSAIPVPQLRRPLGVPAGTTATTPPASSATTPVWTAPAGTPQPGPPQPVPTPLRPAALSPPQADR